MEAEATLKELGLKKQEEKKEENVRHPPCTYFTTSYNAKGEKVINPSLEKQELQKLLHRDNWGRFQFEYERIFETDNYHLVKDRNSTQVYMLANNPYVSKSPAYLEKK